MLAYENRKRQTHEIKRLRTSDVPECKLKRSQIKESTVDGSVTYLSSVPVVFLDYVFSNCICIYTKILEINFFAFAYRLFHEEYELRIGIYPCHYKVQNCIHFIYYLFIYVILTVRNCVY